jgi:hypothetical protein
MINSMSLDTNYKIRQDAAEFFKKFMKREDILTSDRFEESYLPEIIELVNDEEPCIRIIAIETLTEFLGKLNEE